MSGRDSAKLISAIFTLIFFIVPMLRYNSKKRKKYIIEDERQRREKEIEDRGYFIDTENSSNKGDISMLEDLRKKGILSEEEFKEKFKKIQERVNIENKKEEILQNTKQMRNKSIDNLAVIIIVRPGRWSGIVSKYTVVLDGKKIGKIANNSRLKFNIKPGKHNIYVEIFGNVTHRIYFDLFGGEEITIQCISNPVGIYLQLIKKSNSY